MVRLFEFSRCKVTKMSMFSCTDSVLEPVTVINNCHVRFEYAFGEKMLYMNSNGYYKYFKCDMLKQLKKILQKVQWLQTDSQDCIVITKLVKDSLIALGISWEKASTIDYWLHKIYTCIIKEITWWITQLTLGFKRLHGDQKGFSLNLRFVFCMVMITQWLHTDFTGL